MEILLVFKSLEQIAFRVRGWIKQYFSGLEIFLQYLLREILIKRSNLVSILLNKVFAFIK